MTRALCLGRGPAAIAIAAPADGAVVRAPDDVAPWHGAAENQTRALRRADVVLRVAVRDFVVARDGYWCLYCNGHLVICVLQAHLSLVLRAEFDADAPARYECALVAKLRSNMYSDVLRESNEVNVTLVDDGGDAGEARLEQADPRSNLVRPSAVCARERGPPFFTSARARSRRLPDSTRGDSARARDDAARARDRNHRKLPR